jgi:glutamyl-tRNA synthetase
MFEDLHWLGIKWTEGPDIGGPHGPYAQSQRTDLYLSAWRKLRDLDLIYPCTCSRKDVAQSVTAPNDTDDEPLYSGRCRARKEAASFAQPAGVHWRFRIPEGRIVAFEDQHCGPQKWIAGQDFGDFIVWRRDDVAAYQLAVVVDDAAMHISEVVRGADLLKSTARQILLFEALSLAAPSYYHCDLVRDAQGVRLAKQHDALAIRSLRYAGYSPEQVLHSPLAELLLGSDSNAKTL